LKLGPDVGPRLPQALKLGRRLLHTCGRPHVVTQGDERAPLHFKILP